MDIREKLKKKRKKQKYIKISLTSIALVSLTLATTKLTGLSVPNGIKQMASSIYAEIEEIIGLDISEDYADIKGVRINGNEYTFDENKYIYDIELPYNIEDGLKIEYLKYDEEQTISGDSNYVLQNASKTISFDVISKDKTVQNTYTLNLNREHSTYLKNLAMTTYALNPEFNAETQEYTINIAESISKVQLYAIPYDTESVIVIEGNDNINVNSEITIKVTNPHINEERTYKITCKSAVTVNNYSYSGGYQEFIAPYSGIYSFECWGARGGKSRNQGSLAGYPGNGGYAKGDILLRKGEKYYVYVGQQGTDAVVGKDSAATWNGGGLGTWDHADDESSGAGGATDIRLVSGNWNDKQSLASRIIVAGGGGGASYTGTAGAGGGLTGGNGGAAKAGTQISGYSFGIGQNASGTGSSDGVGGGRRRLLGRIHE